MVLLHLLPSEEVVAMTPILWREPSHDDPTISDSLPQITNLEQRKKEVKFRIHLFQAQ